MLNMKVDRIDTSKFRERFNSFQAELQVQAKIAIVRTREDFLVRVADILGSVPAAGGSLPSPYVGVYQQLSTGWLVKKIQFNYMRPIGVATGETQRWLQALAKNPGEIIQNGTAIEIDAGVPRPADMSSGMGDDARSVESRIYLMEFGGSWFGHGVPERPIFRPAVAWYLTLGQDSPFYLECIQARNRAIAKVYRAR